MGLIQIIIYAVIFLLDSFTGFLICLVGAFISAAILIVSLITEMVERSKVPKSYYGFMIVSILSPLIVLGAFGAFYPDAFAWMQE